MSAHKLIHIKNFAQYKLKETGLLQKGWKFVWDNKAVRRYGQCRYNKKEIGVTKKLVAINKISESEDVVLHELAHALVGRGHGHDDTWKIMCRKVGARPERCYKPSHQGGNVNQIKHKYILVHKDTGKVYKRYYRKPKGLDWSNRWMLGKKKETYGKLEIKPNTEDIAPNHHSFGTRTDG